MNYTKHSLQRSGQRGIPPNHIDFILQHGRANPCPGNAYEYSISIKEKDRIASELKQKIQLLDKVVNEAVVVSKEGEILTVYNKK